MKIVPHSGWYRTAKLVHGDATMIVTLEVGPRIMHFGPDDDENLLYHFPHEIGASGGDEYRFYGGHRLWIAPEIPARTMQPDNLEVTTEALPDGIRFEGQPDVNQVRKAIEVVMEDTGVWRIEHEIANLGAYDIELAAWSLSMMRAHTRVIVPQPPFVAHTEEVLPNRPIATWGYTHLGDPRWSWGRRLLSLQQIPGQPPQKLGLFVPQGYAAAQSGDHLWVKRFGAIPDETYPDHGCNFETFTNEDFIEIESLSPMAVIPAEEAIVHTERWRLYPNTTLSENEDEAASQLAELADF